MKGLFIFARMNHPEEETAGGVMEALRGFRWVRILVHNDYSSLKGDPRLRFKLTDRTGFSRMARKQEAVAL
jgi:hypothetical protein